MNPRVGVKIKQIEVSPPSLPRVVNFEDLSQMSVSHFRLVITSPRVVKATFLGPKKAKD